MARIGLMGRRQRTAWSGVAAAAAAVVGGRSAPATTYVWNNTGTAWETGTDFTPTAPAGGPTIADVASFDPTVTPAGLTVVNPTISSATDTALTLSLDNNFRGTTYNFSGAGTLTLGAGGVVIRGVGTHTINGPVLAGNAAGNLAFNIGSGAGLTLAGNTTAVTNPGQMTLAGTLTLDDTGTNTLARLGTTNVVSINGGTLAVLGNAAGGTVNVGVLTNGTTVTTTTPAEGLATISVTDPTGGASTVLNFADTGTFSLRATTGLAYNFVGVGGALGSAGGPQVTFGSAPNVSTTIVGGNGGAIANNTTTTIGFATVTDVNGTNFATYVAPTAGGAGGITAITPSVTGSAAADLSAFTATSVAQFNPAAGATITPTGTGGNTSTGAGGNISSGTLRITPAGAGVTIALGANNLATNALMLDGPNDLTLSATPAFNSTGGAIAAALGGSGTRYVYVNNPATTLTTGLVIANGTNPTNIVGPGFVALNAAASQNTAATTTRLNLLGGTLRGNGTQLGFNASGAGVIAFRGGVLEITNGTDGTGAAADFTRPITATPTAASVNWYSTIAGDSMGGNGGFSAFGSAASVNIGGAATPATLTWGNSAGTGFVQDGEQLIFGSTKSNARLDFLNPVALDSGTAGNYTARTVQVIGGTGGDKTVLAGVISGSNSTDLEKTGTGTLVLPAANTYAGRTIIEAGTVAATTLPGPVIVAAGGTLTAGSGATSTDTVGTLRTGPETWVAGGTLLAKSDGTTANTDEVILSGLTVAATGSVGNRFIVAENTLGSGGTTTLQPGVRLVLADDTEPAASNPFNPALNTNGYITRFALSTSGLVAAPGYTLQLDLQADATSGDDLVLDSFAAAPEPTSLLLAGVAAAPLVLGRRRRTTARTSA